MPAVKITEAKIEKKVLDYCRKHGIYCRKFTSPSNRGVPDRVLCKDGQAMFLELKSAGNKPTPLQQKELADLNAHGMTAVWADNYEDAVKLIMAKFYNAAPAPEKKLSPQELI